MKGLISRFLKGDIRACSRLISLVENNAFLDDDALRDVYKKMGRAHRIGITGPAGVGKSTLIEKLTLRFKRDNRRIGIVAVDPTSPFTHGALLGDRIRMQKIFLDPDVYIRSMATRGALGGLSLKTTEVCNILDAFGKDVILIETVGVGQAEFDITQAADTILVVLVPESGDAIQALKAGLMEIGDIFVINKADREGADRILEEIKGVLDFSLPKDGWRPMVLKTSAISEEGVEELYKRVNEHKRFLEQEGRFEEKKKERIKNTILDYMKSALYEKIEGNQETAKLLNRFTQEVLSGNITPLKASQELIKEVYGRD